MSRLWTKETEVIISFPCHLFAELRYEYMYSYIGIFCTAARLRGKKEYPQLSPGIVCTEQIDISRVFMSCETRGVVMAQASVR